MDQVQVVINSYPSISENGALKIIRPIFHPLIILSPLYAANCDRVLFVTPNTMQVVNILFSAVKSMQKILADDTSVCV